MVIGTYLLIITWNVNGLNAPTKRHKLTEWVQKQDPYICCLQETYFRPRDTYRLKVRGWKKIFHANRNQKKGGVAILISDKINVRKVRRRTVAFAGKYLSLAMKMREAVWPQILGPPGGLSLPVSRKWDKMIHVHSCLSDAEGHKAFGSARDKNVP